MTADSFRIGIATYRLATLALGHGHDGSPSSTAVTVNVTTAPDGPVASTVKLAGTVTTGGVVSVTATTMPNRSNLLPEPGEFPEL